MLHISVIAGWTPRTDRLYRTLGFDTVALSGSLRQTNVYPSAQRRKLREFEGYKRIAVVVVPDQATFEERRKLREEAEGKEVPDGAVMEMKGW